MKTDELLILNDLNFYIAALLNVDCKNKISLDIKQFSFKDNQKALDIIWELECLYGKGIENYTIHLPKKYPPEESCFFSIGSYHRSVGYEQTGIIPEAIARALDRYPLLIDESGCRIWVRANNPLLLSLLQGNADFFKQYGNIKISELDYEKQRKKIISYINTKFSKTNNPKVRISLNDPQLNEIDVIRTLNAMSFENVPEENQKLITIFNIENKREKWVDGKDDITIYIRSDYLFNKHNNENTKVLPKIVKGTYPKHNHTIKINRGPISITTKHKILCNDKEVDLKPLFGRICEFLIEQKGRKITAKQIGEATSKHNDKTKVESVEGYMSTLRNTLSLFHEVDVIHEDLNAEGEKVYYFDLGETPVLI